MLLLLDNLPSMTGLEWAVCVPMDKVNLGGGGFHGQKASRKHDPWNRSAQPRAFPSRLVRAWGRAESQRRAGDRGGQEGGDQIRFCFFLRTALFYKGVFSCLSFEVTFHHFKLLFTASFT